jgi:FixJ family two-component response regulator
VPTIIISAHGDAAARQRCISAGVLAFLSKPLQDRELLAAIGAARKITRNIKAGPTEA